MSRREELIMALEVYISRTKLEKMTLDDLEQLLLEIFPEI